MARSAAEGGDIGLKQLGAGAFVSLAHCAPTGLESVPPQCGLGERQNTLPKFLCIHSFFAQNSRGAALLGLGFCGYE